MKVLHLQSIKKHFQDHHVLHDCTATFEEGKIIGILGRNGAGKTTLFNIISQELAADNGECLLETEEQTLSPVKVSDVAMVFSENYLPDFLTGYEFIQFFLDLHGQEDHLSANEYLDMIDINEEDRHRLIKTYSSGMQSKLSILTVVIMRPPIILLDEPLTSVDIIVGIQLKKIFRELKKSRIVLLSTHILQLAQDLCDEIVLLKDGQLYPFQSDGEPLEDRIIQELTSYSEDANE